ncbi:hypothetical protein E2C01_070229 [Portunus trituberculatus]|uniref:Uncharacterized protein n=1 Tax=Portunus trituberculatus TaxID=210409 RepID=A0A5B7HWQ7_PORTR|nr:hypothetical protein [Portunus trituberculatus]
MKHFKGVLYNGIYCLVRTTLWVQHVHPILDKVEILLELLKGTLLVHEDSQARQFIAVFLRKAQTM